MFIEVNKLTGNICISEGIEMFQAPHDLGKNDFLKGEVYFDSAVFEIKDNKLIFIATPACQQVEIYHTETSEKIIFSNDFFKICNALDTQVINEEARLFFLKKSYAPGGITLIKGVYRLISSNVYFLADGALQHKKISYEVSSQGKQKSCYMSFTSQLELVCNTESKKKKVGVLFSGGADSLALALTLEKLNIPFVLYTGEILPAMKENFYDIARSSSIASEKNWEHVVVKVNYKDYEFSSLHSIIELMPNTSHLSLIFLEIMSKMQTDGVEVCFSGQNLDNLYNFGATASLGFNRASLIDLARRFFVSEYYFSTLDRPLYLRLFSTAVSNFILLGYCLMRRSFTYKLPQSRKELFINFVSSPDNTVFSNSKLRSKYDEYDFDIHSDSELRTMLVRSRVENYLSSGASLSIINSAKLHGIKAVLPYSAEPLIPIFLYLKTGFKDIFRPKKMVHQIIKENCWCIPKDKEKVKNTLPDYHSWAKNYFPKTRFAQSIAVSDVCDQVELATPALILSCRFSSSWIDYVVKREGN